MSTKNIFSVLAVFVVVTCPVAAVAADPPTHDHQQTKGVFMRPAHKSDTASEDCKPTGAEVTTETADDTATRSKDSKVKCEPKNRALQSMTIER